MRTSQNNDSIIANEEILFSKQDCPFFYKASAKSGIYHYLYTLEGHKEETEDEEEAERMQLKDWERRKIDMK